MRIVFLGTPDIAVPTLEALIADKDLSVIAAVTQPDRPSGRGQKLQAPPVKLVCEKHNIPVFQPERLSRAPEVIESLRTLGPDLIVMVAFGQILKKDVLNLPKLGVINLHASLLPAYRGAAPINWALINGDTVTGITTMFTEAGLDTGPILLKDEIPLDNNMNSQELTNIMAQRGALLTVKTIHELMSGTLKAQPQDDSKVTYAPILNKEMGKINWSQPADNIHNLVRGLRPWPLAYTSFRGQPLKIWSTELIEPSKINIAADRACEAGAVILVNKQLLVCCGVNTWLSIKELQPINKAKLAAKDWCNGIHLVVDEKFDF